MTYTTAKDMPTTNILLVMSLINGNFLFNKSLPVIKRTMRAKAQKIKLWQVRPWLNKLLLSQSLLSPLLVYTFV